MKAKTCLSLSILTIALNFGGSAQAADYTWGGATSPDNIWTNTTEPGPIPAHRQHRTPPPSTRGYVTIIGLTIDSPI